MVLTGMVARADGSFLLKRTVTGGVEDAERVGRELGDGLRAEAPGDLLG
jgi:hydroxymethylbilane synthase